MTGVTLNQVNHRSERTFLFGFRSHTKTALLLWLAFAICSEGVMGQSHPASPEKIETVSLTLDQAVEFALSHYPAVRAVLAQAAASRSGVDLARTAYLPRTDLVWQANRATR